MGALARATGVVVVLDVVCVADIARVIVQRENGIVKQITPVDDIDSVKLECFGVKV